MRAQKITEWLPVVWPSCYLNGYLDNRLTPPNPIALKCSSRARVHELVLLSPLPPSVRKGERDGERIELARAAFGSGRYGSLLKYR